MADQFSANFDGVDKPARKLFAITPHASNEVDPLPKAVICTVAGDVVCRAVDSSADVTIALAKSQIFPARLQYVRAAGTTATIVGMA